MATGWKRRAAPVQRDVAILTLFGAGAATPWSVWRLAKGSSGAQRRDGCSTEDANQLRKASTHTSRSAQRPPRDYAVRVTPADRAQTAEDFQTAQLVIGAVRAAVDIHHEHGAVHLSQSP